MPLKTKGFIIFMKFWMLKKTMMSLSMAFVGIQLAKMGIQKEFANNLNSTMLLRIVSAFLPGYW